MKKIFGVSLILLGLFFAVNSFAEGGKVPSLKMRDLKGKTFNIQDLCKKGPLVIDFWATWCSPCKAELPKLKEIYNKYKDQNLTILAISEDGAKELSKVKQFVRSKKFPFVIAIDKNKTIMKKFNAKAMPTTILVAKGGEIISAHAGYVSGDEKKLEKEIEELLNEANKIGEGAEDEL